MFKIKKSTRINYWSSSNLANWIRGEKKPYALEWDKWDKWEAKQKKERPIRFWLSDTLLKKLQDIIYLPYDIYYTIKVYVRNRFIDQTHVLKTGLKAGKYYDLDYRILHGLFNELVDLVEIEYAHLSGWNTEKKYKFKKGRCIEAGLDYLKWASSLRYGDNDGLHKSHKLFGKLTHQAVSSRKVSKLYHWWKNRNNRANPHDIFTKEKHGSKYFLKIDQMENNYYEEDNKMLIELIKIRDSLWT